jgi:hypothetical protein
LACAKSGTDIEIYPGLLRQSGTHTPRVARSYSRIRCVRNSSYSLGGFDTTDVIYYAATSILGRRSGGRWFLAVQ